MKHNYNPLIDKGIFDTIPEPKKEIENLLSDIKIGDKVGVKKKKNKEFYVNNKQLLEELKIYKETGVFTENFGKYIMKIAAGIASKPNFAGYTYISEMCLESVMTTLMYVRNFDIEKSQNPFSYISQIIFNSFRGYLNKEKKISNTKKEMYDEQQCDFINENSNTSKQKLSDIQIDNEKIVCFSSFIEEDNTFGKKEWKLTLKNPKLKLVSITYYPTQKEAEEERKKWIEKNYTESEEENE